MKGLRDLLSDVLMCAGVWLIVSGGAISWPVIGQAAPFKTDKLAVLCLEDSSPQGRAKLTANQENILRAQDDSSVRKFVKDHAGEFQVLDPKNPTGMDVPWVQAAMSATHGDPPWILAASPRGGFSSAIAPDVKLEDVTKQLSTIAPR